MHYVGYNARQNEWIAVGSKRIQPPQQTRSPRQHASTLAADAQRREDLAALGSVTTALGKPGAPQGGGRVGGVGQAALPDGWATAIAAETLREFSERKVCAADWFTAFSAHGVAKRSNETPEQLLALFVLAVNDLQMLGFATACKRPRGTIEKRVFG